MSYYKTKRQATKLIEKENSSYLILGISIFLMFVTIFIVIFS
ncbi:hypothetical protein HNP50_003206 [Elizabethkingia anophelis]|uniref:Uncharacterized protein n=1 Tax=Elizabethkingia anophelis TaxID=1117645 RepID=A0A7Z7LYF4_9FLAO|nr:hypothetical protein [Elizabethkingia anophelis]MCW2468732.1 hypothetical protein [Elizabethkingia anophelis]MCW2472484.1 hypothetical protein [Elizabethkingia anophelis]STD09171.1 Uncharacterised protein [Elizabethkingia anophelis]